MRVLPPQRRRSGKVASVTALVILTFGSGCLPAINHGPRIQEGSSVGVVGSLSAGPRYTGRSLFGAEEIGPYLGGPVGISLGHGTTAHDEDSGRFYLGGHVPIPGFQWAQADLYMQAPELGLSDFDMGIGVNAGYYQYSPYIQFGRIDTGGSGWYTTQGVTFLSTSMAESAFDDVGGWLWVGSVARNGSARGGKRTPF